MKTFQLNSSSTLTPTFSKIATLLPCVTQALQIEALIALQGKTSNL